MPSSDQMRMSSATGRDPAAGRPEGESAGPLEADLSSSSDGSASFFRKLAFYYVFAGACVTFGAALGLQLSGAGPLVWLPGVLAAWGAIATWVWVTRRHERVYETLAERISVSVDRSNQDNLDQAITQLTLEKTSHGYTIH